MEVYEKMKERIIDYDALPVGNVWDGSPIRRTVDCSICPFLVEVQKDLAKVDICAWGVAWKEIQDVDRPRKCIKISRLQPEYNSLSSIRKIL